jgi:hypothetical protein
MRPITVSVAGPLQSNSTTSIRTASAVAAGAVTLNGSLVTAGAANLAVAQNVTVTNGSAETIKLTFTGTTFGGAPVSETLQLGAAATTALVSDFLQIASVTSSGPSVGNISIGTPATATSSWVRFDDWSPSNQVTLQVNVVGTVNYTVQTTLDDPNSPTNPVAAASVTWFSAGDSAIVAATASAQSSFGVLPLFARVLLNSGTGSVMATFVQTGNVSL